MPTSAAASIQTVLNCDQSEKPFIKSFLSINPPFKPFGFKLLSRCLPAADMPAPPSTRTPVLSVPKKVTVCPDNLKPSDVENRISPMDEPIAGLGAVTVIPTVFFSPAFNEIEFAVVPLKPTI